PAMTDGAGVRPFEGGAPLSRGAEIITLTGREAVGIDRAGRPRPLGPARFAVAAIARLGSLRTALPAYAEDERVPALAARAYAAPTEAAAFHPTADEIAAVAVRHFAAGGTLVSFGRACEGEPLLAARLLEAALEMIRARTATGTLHVETNGSSPAALRRLIAAGLDSVAVRLASARAETYERLHGPQGYRFGDVRTSIDAAVRAKVALALVILVMPGLPDPSPE